MGQAHSFISAPKRHHCHLSESSLVFSLFSLTFCHILTLLEPCGKSPSFGERAWEQILSSAVPCFVLGSEAHLAQFGVHCPPESGSPQPQFSSELKSKKTGEGKEVMWRSELLTPCFLGVSTLILFQLPRVKTPSTWDVLCDRENMPRS